MMNPGVDYCTKTLKINGKYTEKTQKDDAVLKAYQKDTKTEI